MDEHLIRIVCVLVVAILIAIVARRLHLPYTIGLVIVGAAIAVLKIDFGVNLTREFIFDVILPPLLFEAALTLHWKELRADLLPVLVLATIGTILAAAVVTAGMVFLLRWPAEPALLFGVLIAATDPVAVIAMFKDNNVKGRLRLLVESESLFNDSVAAVLFGAALAWAGLADGHAPTALDMLTMLRQTVVGGCAIGIFCGAVAILLAGRVSEHLVEAALTTVTAYGSFLLAEHFHMSGVLATVMAGLVMGNLGVLRDSDDSPVSPRGREFVLGFWEFAAFMANSLIFPLIGVRIAQIGFALPELGSLAVAIALTLVGRALTVYPISLLFARSRWSISAPQQHVLFWGGLRGALALALALSLPLELPLRDEITTMTFAVAAFSIIVQGLTMPILLRRAAKA